MSMAKNKIRVEKPARLGPLALVGAGGLSAGLARPADAPHAQRLRAGVSLLFVPLGHVRLPDRRAGQFQRPARDSLCGHGDAGGGGGRVRQLRVRLGLPFRLPAGPDRLGSHAQVHAAAWMGCFRYVVLAVFVLAIPYLWGEGHPLFFCRLCPAGVEAAVPNVARLATPASRSWPSGDEDGDPRLVVLAMLFTWRPWCTLFCPLGAIYGLLNHVSFLFLRFHRDRCMDCEECRNLCLDRGRPSGASTACVASAAWSAPSAGR